MIISFPININNKDKLYCPYCKTEYSQNDLRKQIVEFGKEQNKHYYYIKEYVCRNRMHGITNEEAAKWLGLQKPRLCCSECYKPYDIAIGFHDEKGWMGFVDIKPDKESCHGSTP